MQVGFLNEYRFLDSKEFQIADRKGADDTPPDGLFQK